MHSASSVKFISLVLAGVLGIWAASALAQAPSEEDQSQQESSVIVEQPAADPNPINAPRAPLQRQRNTLCDTSYSRITKCDEHEDSEEWQLPER